MRPGRDNPDGAAAVFATATDPEGVDDVIVGERVAVIKSTFAQNIHGAHGYERFSPSRKANAQGAISGSVYYGTSTAINSSHAARRDRYRALR
jgi:hypothetical protein